MAYTGRLDVRPLLDVIQIVAYSQQSGILTVKGPKIRGLLIFEGGNIVCAYSPTALPLLVKAAKELDERHRLTYRRIQVLTALRELFDLVEGDYRFVHREERVSELEGLDIKSFYDAGALDTGDLLLALEKAMDEEDLVPRPLPPAMAPPGRERDEHADLRRFPRYGPVVIKGILSDSLRSYPGYLTNLSEGGTFFHAETLPTVGSGFELEFDLPWGMGRCRVSTSVVWIRSDGPNTKKGVGLAFQGFAEEARERVTTYLSRFEELAADVDFEA
jgi:Tfp pilus assembly protein PilZ